MLIVKLLGLGLGMDFVQRGCYHELKSSAFLCWESKVVRWTQELSSVVSVKVLGGIVGNTQAAQSQACKHQDQIFQTKVFAVIRCIMRLTRSHIKTDLFKISVPKLKKLRSQLISLFLNSL